MRFRVMVASLLVPSLLAACGGTGDPPVSGSPTASPTPTVTAPPTPSPTPSASVSELPGEPFGRAIAGQSYAVVGVAHDDTLNVRTGPGPDFAIVAELEPDGATIATGRDRLVPSGLWVEVQAGDVTGWASYRFLGLLGSTDDVTSRIVADNDGVIPTADSMAELGAFVAASRASVDPASRITVLGPPGDQLEMTVDVIGVGDDSVKGERLVIFAQSLDDGGGVSLYAVEATIICDRGVDDGICV